ncbi:MAG: hypothetical protein ACJAYG_002117, partial [Oceanicoccus sp.]
MNTILPEKIILLSLQIKLSVTLFGLLIIIGASISWLAESTANRYSLEFYQQLNTPIAMYMTGERQFISQGVANKDSLEDLAH